MQNTDTNMRVASHLARQNLTSMYEQIATTLREEALSGLYDPTGKLPSEADLCTRFSVSRITVRQALAKLTQEGTIQRKQGKGSYLAGKQIRHGLDSLRSFNDSLAMQGLQAEMRLLSKQLVSVPEHLQGKFGSKIKHCLLLQRLHLADGEPVALGNSYLPARVNELSWQEAEGQPNYALLKSIYGQSVARADIAIGAQLADTQLAQVLKVETGSALLVMTRTSSFANGDCCDQSTFLIRPERYEFVASCHFQAN